MQIREGASAVAARRAVSEGSSGEAVLRRLAALLPSPLESSGDVRLRVFYKSYKAGQLIAEPATGDGDVHIIASGYAYSYRFTVDGGRHILGFHSPGDVLALWVFPRSSFFVEALSTTRTATITGGEVQALATLNPGLSKWWHARIGQTVLRLHTEMSSLRRLPADARVALFLTQVRDRLAPSPLPSVLSLPMSRRDIADYLGLSPETISRALTK